MDGDFNSCGYNSNSILCLTGRMSGSSAEAGVARDAIVTALHLGVPLCNDGEFEQATQVYKVQVRSL